MHAHAIIGEVNLGPLLTHVEAALAFERCYPQEGPG